MSHKGDHSGFSEMLLGRGNIGGGEGVEREDDKGAAMDSPKYHPNESYLGETMRHLAAEIIQH